MLCCCNIVLCQQNTGPHAELEMFYLDWMIHKPEFSYLITKLNIYSENSQVLKISEVTEVQKKNFERLSENLKN